MCWDVHENCDVDVAIHRACYQSQTQQEKKIYSSSFLHSFY